jgi:hypothetical protein
MTKINAVRQGVTVGPGATSTRARQAGSAFSVPEETGSTAAEATAPTANVVPVSLSVMFAAEALDQDASRDRAARRKGHAVLAGLTELQRALLDGGDQAASLDRLASLIADMPQAAEPRLAAVLDTIVLRARVELARMELPRVELTEMGH